VTRNRGFTVLEVLVMSAVALFLLGVVYAVFTSSAVDAAKANRKLQALQAVQGLLDRLSMDLQQAYYAKARYPVAVKNSRGGTANELCFHRVDSATVPPTVLAPVFVEPVVYSFDPATATVSIDGRPLANCRFKRVTFAYAWGEPGDFVTVTATGVPDELASVPVGDIDERDLATVVASFAVRSRAMQRRYPTWVAATSLVRSR